MIHLELLFPVIIVFKIFLQELTSAELDWDQPLAESLLERWKALVLSLQNGPSISVPLVYLQDERKPDTYQLCGFCDSSISAYAAVVYLGISIGSERYMQFVASKTRVAPKVTQTIPRLELLEHYTVGLINEYCHFKPKGRDYSSATCVLL